jgi:hypothetical protein
LERRTESVGRAARERERWCPQPLDRRSPPLPLGLSALRRASLSPLPSLLCREHRRLVERRRPRQCRVESQVVAALPSCPSSVVWPPVAVAVPRLSSVASHRRCCRPSQALGCRPLPRPRCSVGSGGQRHVGRCKAVVSDWESDRRGGRRRTAQTSWMRYPPPPLPSLAAIDGGR